MRRLVLICLLMLLPLQWSVAAIGGYGPHPEIEAPDGTRPLAQTLLAASGGSVDIAATGVADNEPPCSSECHVDDPLWIGAPPSGVPPPHAAPPHFEYCAPTSSHSPPGPERPDWPAAA